MPFDLRAVLCCKLRKRNAILGSNMTRGRSMHSDLPTVLGTAAASLYELFSSLAMVGADWKLAVRRIDQESSCSRACVDLDAVCSSARRLLGDPRSDSAMGGRRTRGEHRRHAGRGHELARHRESGLRQRGRGPGFRE